MLSCSTRKEKRTSNKDRKIQRKEAKNENANVEQLRSQVIAKPHSSNLKLLKFSNPPGTNLCFSNAAVSCILNISVLRKMLEKNTIQFEKDSISNELKSLFETENLAKASTQKLRTIVKTKCFENGQYTKNFNDNMQHDSGEFMLSLFEHLWNENIQEGNHLKENVFGGISQHTLICKCGKKVEHHPEDMSEILPIQIIGESVQSGFDEIFSEEYVSRNCSNCEKKSAIKKLSLINEPSTIILQLMRYNFDMKKCETQKNHQPVFCSQNLIMPSGKTYSLKSLISHIGENTRSGHYNVTLFDKESGENILLDDSRVTYLSESSTTSTSNLSYIIVYEAND